MTNNSDPCEYCIPDPISVKDLFNLSVSCETTINGRIDSFHGRLIIDYDDPNGVYRSEFITIDYCPKCGRKF